jgi:hypothetical protein
MLKIKEEFLKLLPPTLFFFIALHLVYLLRTLMLEGTSIALSGSMSVTIGSLILGKAVLIADMLPFINRYPVKPLIYNISWKTFIYLMIASLIHYIERLIDSWQEAGGFLAGNELLLEQKIWTNFLAIEIFLFVLILNYCTIRELARLIGEDKVKRIFFGPK